jgi:hypothetical protein
MKNVVICCQATRAVTGVDPRQNNGKLKRHTPRLGDIQADAKYAVMVHIPYRTKCQLYVFRQ